VAAPENSATRVRAANNLRTGVRRSHFWYRGHDEYGKALNDLPLQLHSGATLTSRGVKEEALIQDDPGTYYLKEHYVNYQCVLVRLSRIHTDALRDLVTGAYRFVSARMGRNLTDLHEVFGSRP
jgi:hypothetical protein